MSRLKHVAALLCLCGVLAAVAAPAAAAFPDRPLRLIVGMPPGGGADTVARLVSAKAAEKLGQPIVVENKPGADGSIGAEMVARAPPDGYTLAWITNSHVVSPLHLPLSYNAATSFAPVTQVSQAPDVVLVPTAFAANSMAELVAMAKAKPDELVYGTAGPSTPSSLEISLLMSMTGIKMLGIPYKGGSEVMVALLNGSVQIYSAAISTALPYVNTGKLKALGVTSKARAPQLPNLPTVAEALNLPGFEGGNWLGVLAPAGTPKEVVDRLNAAFVEAINSTDVKERLANLGWTTIASTPDAFAGVIRNDLARWAEAFKGSPPK
ncbi:MAG: tripartite tricarboxylate transporter substrate binding protein [Casimicrobiaceae bacterium]